MSRSSEIAEITATEAIAVQRVDDFVTRWLDAWNSRQPERVLELMADDIVYDDSAWPRTMRGHAQARELLDFLWRGFPDFTVEAVGGPLVASDGRRAAFRWPAHGKHT